jgi:hypothetical protein
MVIGLKISVVINEARSTPEGGVSLALPGGAGAARVATPDPSQPPVEGPFMSSGVLPVSMDVDLRQLPPAEPRRTVVRPELHLRLESEAGSAPAGSTAPDPALQTQQPLAAMPAPLQSFEGLNYACCGSGWPPDTNGDVGPTYYIQTVNTSIGIFDKASGTQLSAVSFDSFFNIPGTACDNDNNGDPIALYDPLADRWLVSDFAWTSANLDSGPYYECIAVSKTSNPVSGGWWLYALRTDDAAHPWLADYPKLGVWPDGYYLSANMFDCVSQCGAASVFEGVRVWALDRASMLTGGALNEVHFDISANSYDEVILPANLRGTPPPAGSPNFFVAMDDNYLGTDVLHLWKFAVNWANLANSKFTGPTNLPTASFTPFLSNVPQPGTSAQLDSLGDRLMMQLQYRNLNGTESLWVNHTVNAGTGASGIRWYEIRNPNGSPAIYQQGTYAPTDGAYRWMGSLAVDHNGNMALGYSASSAAIFPAIRYAGRLASDALGMLAQGETELRAGGGSQTGGSAQGRWGDYSAMSVDPADDCTFWYTNEYYDTSGTAWRTRIGSFKFPTCALVAQGILAGQVTNAASQPLPNALIQAVSGLATFTTTTNASGAYSLTLLSGTYAVTAAQYGYLPVTVSGLSIANNVTTPQNFALNVAATYTISGGVSDSTLGWPLYATLMVSGSLVNPPTPTVRSDLNTGVYSLTLAGGQAYTLTASAPLHADAAQNLGVVSSDQTQNFALTTITTTGGLIGYVKDFTNSAAIPNALVVAATGSLSATTDAQGIFQLIGLAPGFYTATASAAFYSAVSITEVQALPGNLTPITFSLPTPVFSYSALELSRTVTFRTLVSDSSPIVITNTGLGELSYEFLESTGSAAPDTYTVITSSGASGLTYSWIDATSGTALNLSDDETISLTLPFSFPFYSSAATGLWVNNNGLAFPSQHANNFYYTNADLTLPSTPDEVLAPFWDDLDSETGNVYWMVTGAAPQRAVVVEWYNRPHFSQTGPVEAATFEMVLFEGGDILYQYQDVNFGDAAFDAGASATVGIRGATAASAQQYSFNAANLQNNLALCFDNSADPSVCGVNWDALPWLNVSPAAASLPGGVTHTLGLTLTWDTTVPQVRWAGTYTGTLWITTNDPQYPSATVPVTMNVPIAYNIGFAPVYTRYTDPGTTTNYPVTVINTGNTTDTFTVTVSSSTFTATMLSATVGPLGASDSATWVVSVTVPAGAANGDSGTTTLTGTSESDPSKSASTTLVTVVGYIRVYLPIIAK